MTESSQLAERAAAAAMLERTVEALGLHFARDHIGLAEFERRLDEAYAASGPDDWQSLLADLPSLPEPRGADPMEPPERSPAKRGFVANVLGRSTRRGRWTPPPKLIVMPLAGGALLDFREATFTTDEVEVTILSFLGATEIVVPPDLCVEVGGLPIAGEFEHHAEGTTAGQDPRLLRVKGITVLGSVEVKVIDPGETYRPNW